MGKNDYIGIPLATPPKLTHLCILPISITFFAFNNCINSLMSCDSSALHIMVCLEAVCTVACNINRERTCNVLLILLFHIIIPQV